MTTLEVFRAARERITDLARWSGYGWGFNGRECALHALWSASGGLEEDVLPVVIPGEAELERVTGCGYLGIFNDTHSHAEILAAFDRAIEIEEAREAEMTAGIPISCPVLELGVMSEFIREYDKRMRESRLQAEQRHRENVQRAWDVLAESAPRPVRRCGACAGTGIWDGPYLMRCRYCAGTGHA